jgi:Nif-specific regulatory protein
MPGALVQGHHMKMKGVTVNQETLKVRVDAYEKKLVFDAIRRAQGNQSRAARILGTSQRIVNYKIRKYGIDTGQFR